MARLKYNSIIKTLKNISLSLDHKIIGASTQNTPIYCFHIGPYNKPQILLEAGIHAREYISTLALIKEMIYLNRLHPTDFGTYFIPLTNPDGVKLVLDGSSDFDNKTRNSLYKLNNNCNQFDLWKANINGVDLNVNFDALWGTGRYNMFTPSPANYIGPHPHSEPETIALVNFLSTIKIIGSLSIHSKGEVVYYGYDNLTQQEIDRDKHIANLLSAFLNFKAEKTIDSVGGFSDFISEKLHIPAFTIELGNDNLTHPITIKHLKFITPNFLGITQYFYNVIQSTLNT